MKKENLEHLKANLEDGDIINSLNDIKTIVIEINSEVNTLNLNFNQLMKSVSKLEIEEKFSYDKSMKYLGDFLTAKKEGDIISSLIELSNYTKTIIEATNETNFEFSLVLKSSKIETVSEKATTQVIEKKVETKVEEIKEEPTSVVNEKVETKVEEVKEEPTSVVDEKVETKVEEKKEPVVEKKVEPKKVVKKTTNKKPDEDTLDY